MRTTLILTVLSLVFLLGNIGTNSAHANAVSSYRMRVLQTAYCLRGTMASGRYVHYGAVAVDPYVIPIGTRIYIPGYGRGRAEDTGGAIRGRHIDVWVPSCSTAMHMTRYVTITVYR